MDNSNLSDAWDWQGSQDQENADRGAYSDPFTLEDDGLADLAGHPASRLTRDERDALELARMEASECGDFTDYYRLCHQLRSSNPGESGGASVSGSSARLAIFRPGRTIRKAPRQGVLLLHERAETHEIRRTLPPRRWQVQQALVLTPDERSEYTFLAAVLELGWRLRLEKRPAEPTIECLRKMRRKRGRLVWVRLRHPSMNGGNVTDPEDRARLEAVSKKEVAAWMGRHARKVGPDIICAAHWDDDGAAHSHTGFPFEALSKELQKRVLAAPVGRGGGVEIDARTHLVLIGDTDEDLQRVGGYMCHFPHAAARLAPENRDPRQLALFDQIAQSMLSNGGKSQNARMIWRPGYRWRVGKPL